MLNCNIINGLVVIYTIKDTNKMGKQGRFTGEWSSEKEKIIVNLHMIEFEEDGCKIVYCPALDVSGYGKDLKEATDSFNVSLSEFFKYGIHKQTIFDELKSMGWIIKDKHKQKNMQAPSMSKLLENNANFNRIFNDFPLRKYDQKIEIPVC